MSARLGAHDGIEFGQRFDLFGDDAAHRGSTGPGFLRQVEHRALQLVAGRLEFLAELGCGHAHCVGCVAKPAGCIGIGPFDIAEQIGLGLAQGVAGALAFAGGQVADGRDLAGDGIGCRCKRVFHRLAGGDQAALGLVDGFGDRLSETAQAVVDFVGPDGKAFGKRFHGTAAVFQRIHRRVGHFCEVGGGAGEPIGLRAELARKLTELLEHCRHGILQRFHMLAHHGASLFGAGHRVANGRGVGLGLFADIALQAGEVAGRGFQNTLQQEIAVVELTQRLGDLVLDAVGRFRHDVFGVASIGLERGAQQIGLAAQRIGELVLLGVDEFGKPVGVLGHDLVDLGCLAAKFVRCMNGADFHQILDMDRSNLELVHRLADHGVHAHGGLFNVGRNVGGDVGELVVEYGLDAACAGFEIGHRLTDGAVDRTGEGGFDAVGAAFQVAHGIGDRAVDGLVETGQALGSDFGPGGDRFGQGAQAVVDHFGDGAARFGEPRFDEVGGVAGALADRGCGLADPCGNAGFCTADLVDSGVDLATDVGIELGHLAFDKLGYLGRAAFHCFGDVCEAAVDCGADALAGGVYRSREFACPAGNRLGHVAGSFVERFFETPSLPCDRTLEAFGGLVDDATHVTGAFGQCFRQLARCDVEHRIHGVGTLGQRVVELGRAGGQRGIKLFRARIEGRSDLFAAVVECRGELFGPAIKGGGEGLGPAIECAVELFGAAIERGGELLGPAVYGRCQIAGAAFNDRCDFIGAAIERGTDLLCATVKGRRQRLGTDIEAGIERIGAGVEGGRQGFGAQIDRRCDGFGACVEGFGERCGLGVCHGAKAFAASFQGTGKGAALVVEQGFEPVGPFGDFGRVDVERRNELFALFTNDHIDLPDAAVENDRDFIDPRVELGQRVGARPGEGVARAFGRFLEGAVEAQAHGFDLALEGVRLDREGLIEAIGDLAERRFGRFGMAGDTLGDLFAQRREGGPERLGPTREVDENGFGRAPEDVADGGGLFFDGGRYRNGVRIERVHERIDTGVDSLGDVARALVEGFGQGIGAASEGCLDAFNAHAQSVGESFGAALECGPDFGHARSQCSRQRVGPARKRGLDILDAGAQNLGNRLGAAFERGFDAADARAQHVLKDLVAAVERVGEIGSPAVEQGVELAGRFAQRCLDHVRMALERDLDAAGT